LTLFVSQTSRHRLIAFFRPKTGSYNFIRGGTVVQCLMLQWTFIGCPLFSEPLFLFSRDGLHAFPRSCEPPTPPHEDAVLTPPLKLDFLCRPFCACTVKNFERVSPPSAIRLWRGVPTRLIDFGPFFFHANLVAPVMSGFLVRELGWRSAVEVPASLFVMCLLSIRVL